MLRVSQSFSAKSIRVCHPSPEALNALMTSGDSRMVVDTLVAADDGRPTGRLVSPFALGGMDHRSR